MTFAALVDPVYFSTPHKYRISFTTATALRDGSKIQFGFNYTVPTGDEFYCTIDKPAYDTVTGLDCYRASATMVYITNLAAISAGTAIVVDLNLIHDGDNTDSVTVTTMAPNTFSSVDVGTVGVTTNMASETAYIRYDLSNVVRTPVERSNTIRTRTGRVS